MGIKEISSMKHSLLLIFLLFSPFLKADVWGPVETEFFYSSDSTYMLKIVPTFTPEKYWKWLNAKPKKKKKFSAKDTTRIPCYAVLYKVSAHDTLQVWKEKLINRLKPVSAFVSNDGKYVVKFDTWHTNGYGVNTMVVYNEKGALIKRYRLEEISPFPINYYRMTISSIWWSCGKEFIDDNRFKICFETEDGEVERRTYHLDDLNFL